MQWTSEGIIIKQQAFNDEKSIYWILTATHGLYKGLYTLNKKTRTQIQVGSIVTSTWKARLPEHLGNFYCELIKPLSMMIINDKQKLAAVVSICDILSDCLPEKVIEEKIYDHLITFLLTLKENSSWLLEYLRLELEILQASGYGLHLDVCALTGARDNLRYVSPKTGKAACLEAGKEYHDKLLILPEFFIKDNFNDQTELAEGFKLTGHFLYNRLYKTRHINLPTSRELLLKLLFK